jgi:hypothetical protein
MAVPTLVTRPRAAVSGVGIAEATVANAAAAKRREWNESIFV